jgi:hypothetical protein
MIHYTFNGTRLFRSLDTAAKYAIDNFLHPSHLQCLEDGKLRDADDCEQDALFEKMK